jgi:hypothetical protein
MKKPYLALKIVLAVVAAIHIIIGILGVIPASPLSIVLAFYGGALQFSPQIGHLLQIFGAYMLTIGALCIYAIWDPIKNKCVIHGLIFLLLFRGGQRILTADQTSQVFGLVPQGYWIQTILFLAVGLILLWLRPKAVLAQA